MKSRFRLALLVGVLIMAGYASGHAYPWPPGYGTCYINCGGVQYVQDYRTSQECCSQNPNCPDNNPPYITWSPDEGWPLFCPPYAD